MRVIHFMCYSDRGVQSQVLKEPADITGRVLLVIFDCLWALGEVTKDHRKVTATPVSKENKETQGTTSWSALIQPPER